MTQIKLTAYVPKDLEEIELRDHEQVNIKRQTLGVILEETISVTMLNTENGLVIAILGYQTMAPGLIEVFVIPSIYVPKYALSFVKTVKTYIKAIEKVIPEFRRMETRSLANPDTDRWMKALGFELEGTHRKYAPDGSDYRTWARVNDG
jgi:hypothetical protein